jgi:hypothetical protein
VSSLPEEVMVLILRQEETRTRRGTERRGTGTVKLTESETKKRRGTSKARALFVSV